MTEDKVQAVFCNLATDTCPRGHSRCTRQRPDTWNPTPDTWHL